MKNELNNMTVGHTKNVGGHVVTRWSENCWEVGTWGRKTQTLDEAIEAVYAVEDLGACFERNIVRMIMGSGR